MRAVLAGLIASLVSTGVGAGSASALSCAGSPFEKQIGRAAIIFVGTVESDTCVWAPCTPEGTDTCTIVTKYRFDRVTYLKGQGPADSLVLIQRGGIIGNDGIVSDGGVRFESGSRYVVLAYPWDPRHYTASPCVLGPFGIWPDSCRAEPVVHLGKSPLIAFDGIHLVGLHSTPWSPDFGPWEVDASGVTRPPGPPPRLPLPELLRRSDEELRLRLVNRGLSEEHMEEVAGRIRTVSLFPHQDPGSRVSEAEFLKALNSVIARVGPSAKTK